MIVRNLDDCLGTSREVRSNGWTSRRLLLRDDGMGFSLHDTLIHAGAVLEMEYRNHLEAVYCIEGSGTLQALATGETWTLRPGTVYALNANDRHVVTADEELRMVCVFNPPVIGDEVHDDSGAYPAAAT